MHTFYTLHNQMWLIYQITAAIRRRVETFESTCDTSLMWNVNECWMLINKSFCDWQANAMNEKKQRIWKREPMPIKTPNRQRLKFHSMWKWSIVTSYRYRYRIKQNRNWNEFVIENVMFNYGQRFHHTWTNGIFTNLSI